MYLLTSHAPPALRQSGSAQQSLRAIELVTHARTTASERRQQKAIDAKLAAFTKRAEHPRVKALRESIIQKEELSTSPSSSSLAEASATSPKSMSSKTSSPSSSPSQPNQSKSEGKGSTGSSNNKNNNVSPEQVQAAVEMATAAGLSASDLEELNEYTFSTFGFVPPEANSMTTPRTDTFPEPTNTHTDSSQTRTMRGYLSHKQWSLTAESYVAGGSNYFTLEIVDRGSSSEEGRGNNDGNNRNQHNLDSHEEIILRVDPLKPPSASLLGLPASTPADQVVKHMNNYLEQLATPPVARSAKANLVEVEGFDRMESTTHPTSELEPHPMGFEDSITTHTFVVTKVTSLSEPAIKYDPSSLARTEAERAQPNVVGKSDLKPNTQNMQSVEVPVSASAAGATRAAGASNDATMY